MHPIFQSYVYYELLMSVFAFHTDPRTGYWHNNINSQQMHCPFAQRKTSQSQQNRGCRTNAWRFILEIKDW